MDTTRWRIRVRHPKGEIRYGKKREAIILPPARPAVIRFLEARKSRLEKLGANSVALIPALHDGMAGFYSSNSLRKFKKELEDAINKNSKGDKTCHWTIRKKGEVAKEKTKSELAKEPGETALELLKKRLVKGEISQEQYRQLRDILLEK